MNDNVSAIQTIAKDAINSGTDMMPVDMSTGRIDRVDASRYYIQPTVMSAVVKASDITQRVTASEELWEELNQGSFRPTYDPYIDGRSNRAEELINVRLEETLRQIHRLEERIYRESTSASVMASQLNALQITVAKQAEAMQILAAEIDELKSGQLEPLEDME